MSYLLDSNTCIRFLNSRSEALIDRLTLMPDDAVFVCSIVKAELFFGSSRSRQPKRSREIQEAFFARYASLPFGDDAADTYAEIRSHLESAGTPIGANDLLIAAIARANGLVLVTHNTREFGRVPGLVVEDWEV